MKLANSYVCLDCDEINGRGNTCNTCASTSLYPIARFVESYHKNWRWLTRIGSLAKPEPYHTPYQVSRRQYEANVILNQKIDLIRWKMHYKEVP